MNHNEFETINKSGDEIKVLDGVIYLLLKSEKPRSRTVGKLFLRPSNNAVSYHKGGLNDEEHLFRKTNSYGINDYILQKLPLDGIIKIESDNTTYMCTVEHAKSVGHYFHFLPQGFEKQCFVSKDKFQKVI